MCGRFSQSMTRLSWQAKPSRTHTIRHRTDWPLQRCARHQSLELSERKGDRRQPCFIQHADGQPIFMTVIGSTPFERGDEDEGVLTVTIVAGKGLVYTH